MWRIHARPGISHIAHLNTRLDNYMYVTQGFSNWGLTKDWNLIWDPRSTIILGPQLWPHLRPQASVTGPFQIAFKIGYLIGRCSAFAVGTVNLLGFSWFFGISSSSTNTQTAFWHPSLKLLMPTRELTWNHGCRNQLMCDITYIVPISLFGSHGSFAHSNLTPMKRWLFELCTKQNSNSLSGDGVDLPSYVRKFDWWIPKRSLALGAWRWDSAEVWIAEILSFAGWSWNGWPHPSTTATTRSWTTKAGVSYGSW